MMQAEEAVSRIKVCLYRIALNYFLMLIAVHVDFDWFFFYFGLHTEDGTCIRLKMK